MVENKPAVPREIAPAGGHGFPPRRAKPAPNAQAPAAAKRPPEQAEQTAIPVALAAKP